MPKLLYISLMRLPTEKAHGSQIMQNCEAFAAAGCQVTLWVARRWNTRAMRKIGDPYAWYGVEPSFRIRRVPCIDLFPLFPAESAASRMAFYVQALSYALVCALLLLIARADIYYSRDELLVWLLGWLKPQRKIAYEAHLYPPAGRSANLQQRALSRAGSMIAITEPLRRDLVANRRASSRRSIAAHDGIRRARYADLPAQAVARQKIGWGEGAFIVGYVGRLQMIGMDKGVASLVEALAAVPGVWLALVGGPEDMAEALRQRWIGLGLPPRRFLYAGQAPPAVVPQYLRAFDVCAMPHPATTQFANYTSPLKLFEYMAAGRAIVASDLASWADVLAHEETALLLPPGDSEAWASVITRLRDDPALRWRLGDAAREMALARYTWDARAERILAHIARTS
ncbi:MAG: glycosyltransferase family 4 protein [Chloroflexi bacterium]|nr:glycosyltransferase family 4 protein [Chloroflexota bacterium]MCY4248766.1 glycosyltransferase family 4 protein [Chloroflexota bacterium]